MIPRATYRIQFHAGFTFADAEAIVPYLADLGISHLYASPVTTARRGSTHGYDVVDPTRINPELGGEDGFRRLATALGARDMSIIIDIVPNHMGVAGGENPWWNDVLAYGRDSGYARFFDIDWDVRLVLPILGDTLPVALADGSIRLASDGGDHHLMVYAEHRLPLRPDDVAALGGGRAADDHDPFHPEGRARLEALLARQHYRLASWRTANDDLNWRRFFTINELAGLRIEDPDVFEATHALYFRLYTEGLIDGVRVDHVDGLTDPAGYCRTLRARFDALPRDDRAYIVVEKILGPGEALDPAWSIDGTSGYDFMADITALLHDPAGEAPLTALWTAISGRDADFVTEELRARQDMLAWQFEGQLGRCVAAFAELAASTSADLTTGMLRRAVERLLWVFPVYRTYGNGLSAPAGDAVVRAAVRARVAPFVPPGEAGVVDLLLDWLAGTGPGNPALAAEAVRRFQQLSSPIAAKSVEDTAFYRYGRLLSGNDVGSDATRFSRSVADFHAAMIERAARWPHALLATATHDHKRGEDVRARLAVLSEVPGEWAARVDAWHEASAEAAAGVDPADMYMLYQTLFGAWPDGLAVDDAAGLRQFADRVIGWQEKSLREAKLRSSWEQPDEAYERRARQTVKTLLDPDRSGNFLDDLAAFVRRTSPAAMANSLVQTCIRYTVPGVPDLFQGCELADRTLVDPDNRRPVDFTLRRDLLAADATSAPDAKLALIARLLALRAADPDLFSDGRYDPVEVTGDRAGHVLAFRRSLGTRHLSCAVALRCAGAFIGRDGIAAPTGYWGDTTIAFDGPRLAAAEAFAATPIYLALDPIVPRE